MSHQRSKHHTHGSNRDNNEIPTCNIIMRHCCTLQSVLLSILYGLETWKAIKESHGSGNIPWSICILLKLLGQSSLQNLYCRLWLFVAEDPVIQSNTYQKCHVLTLAVTSSWSWGDTQLRTSSSHFLHKLKHFLFFYFFSFVNAILCNNDVITTVLLIVYFVCWCRPPK